MNAREFFAIAPIAALCLWIGVTPQPILNVIRPDVDAVVALYTTGYEEIASSPPTPLNLVRAEPTLNSEP